MVLFKSLGISDYVFKPSEEVKSKIDHMLKEHVEIRNLRQLLQYTDVLERTKETISVISSKLNDVKVALILNCQNLLKETDKTSERYKCDLEHWKTTTSRLQAGNEALLVQRTQQEIIQGYINNYHKQDATEDKNDEQQNLLSMVRDFSTPINNLLKRKTLPETTTSPAKEKKRSRINNI